MKKDLKYLEWSDDFSVHVKLIDRQHKYFVGIMDDLFKAMQSYKIDAVSKIIDELITYANAHFATEEMYFIKFNYAGAAEHIAAHNKLRESIQQFLARKDDDPLTLGYNLLDFLEEWLFKHITSMDKKYVKCFREHGLR